MCIKMLTFLNTWPGCRAAGPDWLPLAAAADPGRSWPPWPRILAGPGCRAAGLPGCRAAAAGRRSEEAAGLFLRPEGEMRPAGGRRRGEP